MERRHHVRELTTVSGSTFIGNSAQGNGGAVASMPGSILKIPERTIATIGPNAYGGNRARQGPSLYGSDSIINGDPTSPVIR